MLMLCVGRRAVTETWNQAHALVLKMEEGSKWLQFPSMAKVLARLWVPAWTGNRALSQGHVPEAARCCCVAAWLDLAISLSCDSGSWRQAALFTFWTQKFHGFSPQGEAPCSFEIIFLFHEPLGSCLPPRIPDRDQVPFLGRLNQNFHGSGNHGLVWAYQFYGAQVG